MYEVLEYEATLELKDRGGKKATFKKREKVRYLQDSVRAWTKYFWCDSAPIPLTLEAITAIAGILRNYSSPPIRG